MTEEEKKKGLADLPPEERVKVAREIMQRMKARESIGYYKKLESLGIETWDNDYYSRKLAGEMMKGPAADGERMTELWRACYITENPWNDGFFFVDDVVKNMKLEGGASFKGLGSSRKNIFVEENGVLFPFAPRLPADFTFDKYLRVTGESAKVFYALYQYNPDFLDGAARYMALYGLERLSVLGGKQDKIFETLGTETQESKTNLLVCIHFLNERGVPEDKLEQALKSVESVSDEISNILAFSHICWIGYTKAEKEPLKAEDVRASLQLGFSWLDEKAGDELVALTMKKEQNLIQGYKDFESALPTWEGF